MKPIKNKRRFHPRYSILEGVRSPTPKKNNISVEWSLNEFVVDDPTPTGKPVKKNSKEKDLGLPPEVKKDDPFERSRRDSRSMEEGHCGSEMPLEAPGEEIMNLSPNEAYDTGYADAVQEIVDSISHLLHDPVGEPIATEVAEEKKPDFPDIDGDGDREEPISKAAKDKESMNEQPSISIEDMIKDSPNNSKYKDYPLVNAKLNRKRKALETNPIADGISSRNPESIKSSIRNWLRIGYGIDEIELTIDNRPVDVAEFLDIDPVEES